jgi:hypothetical protein
MIGSGLAGSQTWGIPAGFDTEGFLKSAKANFVSLQAAWDKSDIAALRVMMTDTMLKEIQAQLAEREAHTGGPANLTDVVMIEAHLLGIEDLGDDYMASVEFSGMIREEPSAGPSPFREVWNMTKPKNGLQWLAGCRGSGLAVSSVASISGNNRGLWQHSPLFLCWKTRSRNFPLPKLQPPAWAVDEVQRPCRPVAEPCVDAGE